VTAISLLNSAEFVDSVLRLRPRLATFDCDGTLWAGDAGEGFFDWELQQRLVSDEVARWARPRYADYKAGKVDEDTMCGEMVTMHRGLTEIDVQRAANQYFDENFAGQIFPEMRDLVRRLRESGCDVWAVSSTNEWVIRAGMKHCGIAGDRVLAAAVAIEDGRITDRLVHVPSGEGKSRAICDVIRRAPDVAFGNSRWDAEMLKLAQHPFAVNPNAELQKIAQANRWPVYFPDSIRP
jgi:HAD superfamily phosphoserine phosphatase-like hydrolase